jgi:hypothetical protein
MLPGLKRDAQERRGNSRAGYNRSVQRSGNL